MVNIEIDGVKLEAEQGSMIIEAADKAGIEIPRFCYHKKLSVAANCRMCLVEVANAPKAVPACATPISDGMVVRTQSERAKEAQKSVMEFLLINHPLDCPICDQGGECELQDVALGYGRDISRFTERKRVVKDKDIGPLIATDMTRCIHCTRCVRFGQEIAGIRELGATGRGEHMEIGTFIEKSVDSEVSGNVIDLCPVGALTAKPSRFKARAWEMEQHNGIAPHDCLGSHVHIHTRRNEVIRVVPRENESINEVWLSDRDRFSYEALAADNRATQPMIRKNDNLEVVDWQTALQFAADRLNVVKKELGSETIGALVSASATCEEMYLLRQLMSHLESESIDFRMAYRDDRTPFGTAFPDLGLDLSELENQGATLLIASHLRKEQPLAALRLRKSTWEGKIMAIDGEPTEHNLELAVQVESTYKDLVPQLLAVIAAVLEKENKSLDDKLLSAVKTQTPEDSHREIAEHLLATDNSLLLLGEAAQTHSQAAEIAFLSRVLAELSGSTLGQLSPGANSAGAYQMLLPGSTGKSASNMLNEGMKAFILHNCEPELDSHIKSEALTALEQSELTICLTSFLTDAHKQFADVILPIAAFTETSGSYINATGAMQSFAGAVAPKGEARPGWKVLRVLGNLLEVSGFQYVSSEDVLADVKSLPAIQPSSKIASADMGTSNLNFEAGGTASRRNMYDIDSLVRRASSLQKTLDGQAKENN